MHRTVIGAMMNSVRKDTWMPPFFPVTTARKGRVETFPQCNLGPEFPDLPLGPINANFRV